jgi:hypothetical protein
MCLFITAVLPRDARSHAFEALVLRHRLSFIPCENAHVRAQLRPGEQYVHATLGHCDCGSPLFFQARGRPSGEVEREVLKRRKQGWSETKISRWVTSTGPRPHQQSEWHERCWSVGDWAAFLADALALPRVPYIGILGHSYSGDVDLDELEIKGRASHTLDELRDAKPAVLDWDVIHEFRLAAPSAA